MEQRDAQKWLTEPSVYVKATAFTITSHLMDWTDSKAEKNCGRERKTRNENEGKGLIK